MVVFPHWGTNGLRVPTIWKHGITILINITTKCHLSFSKGDNLHRTCCKKLVKPIRVTIVFIDVIIGTKMIKENLIYISCRDLSCTGTPLWEFLFVFSIFFKMVCKAPPHFTTVLKWASWFAKFKWKVMTFYLNISLKM